MKIYILYYYSGNNSEVRGVFDDFNKLKKIIYEDTKDDLEYYKDDSNHCYDWVDYNKIIKKKQNIINNIFNCKDCDEVENLCLEEYGSGYWCYETELNKAIY